MTEASTDDLPSGERLLEQKEVFDAEVLRRSRSGTGLSSLVSEVMRKHGRVHVIWQDRSSPARYGCLVVSNGGDAREAASRGATIETQDRTTARWLVRDFGSERSPRGKDWVLIVRVRDPDGGHDEDGYPRTLLCMETAPEAARAFEAMGYDVRGGLAR